MQRNTVWIGLAAAGFVLSGCAGMAPQPGPQNMTFFVTSVGPGSGGNLGGLAGADAHCQKLATAVGAGGRTWRAYLSTQAAQMGGTEAVNARDRIGTGPWQNVAGVVVARSVDDLHSAANNINKQTALNEKGQPVNGRGDTPLSHDMLTGSRPDGTAFPSGGVNPDMTCGNWTKGGADGSAMLGHHDRMGPAAVPWAQSWNSSHISAGCDAPKLLTTGGAGLFYCFAAN
jgi:hypothetical protein